MRTSRDASPVRQDARAEQVDVLTGGRGNPLDRAVTWRDLRNSAGVGAILASLGVAPGFKAVVGSSGGLEQALAAAAANNAAAEILIAQANQTAAIALNASQTASRVVRQGRGVLRDSYFSETTMPLLTGKAPAFISPGLYATGRIMEFDLGTVETATITARSDTAFWTGPRYAPAYAVEAEIGAEVGDVVVGAGWLLTVTPFGGTPRSFAQALEGGPETLAPGERAVFSSVLLDPNPGAMLPSDVVSISLILKDAAFGTALARVVQVHRIDVKEATVTQAMTRALATSVANIEGYSAATFSFRARAGSATGIFELVATDDAVNGPATLFRVNSDVMLIESGLAVFGGNMQSTGYTPGRFGTGWSISNSGNAQFGTLQLREGAITSALDAELGFNYDPVWFDSAVGGIVAMNVVASFFRPGTASFEGEWQTSQPSVPGPSIFWRSVLYLVHGQTAIAIRVIDIRQTWALQSQTVAGPDDTSPSETQWRLVWSINASVGGETTAIKAVFNASSYLHHVIENNDGSVTTRGLQVTLMANKR